jgi:hypothetical protein
VPGPVAEFRKQRDGLADLGNWLCVYRKTVLIQQLNERLFFSIEACILYYFPYVALMRNCVAARNSTDIGSSTDLAALRTKNWRQRFLIL